MSGWTKADVDDRKAALTRRRDYGRIPYSIEFREFLRHTSTIFSTNNRDFMQDSTGDRRLWGVVILRGAANVEALRRDRDQFLAEALWRLGAGEPHWPSAEEEERVIAPERRLFVPTAMAELADTLERYLTAAPTTPCPKGDWEWKWTERPEPLTSSRSMSFSSTPTGSIAACRGTVAAGRVSARPACATWLGDRGWYQGQKRAPDGKATQIWRAPEPGASGRNGPPQAPVLQTQAQSSESQTRPAAPSECPPASGVRLSETAPAGQMDPAAALCRPKKAVRGGEGSPPSRLSCKEKIAKRGVTFRADPTPEQIDVEVPIFEFADVEIEKFTLDGVCAGALGLQEFGGCERIALADLDGVFPPGQPLAVDIETTGLSEVTDGVRTVQIANGAHAALAVFARPVRVSALAIFADFLRGRRLIAHNARFEASWLRQAGIEPAWDDTILAFAATRGARLPAGGQKGMQREADGGRIRLAGLAEMVLNVELDKTEQVSDWSAEVLSPAQLRYATLDAVVTWQVWAALREEMARKSAQYGVNIAEGYEALRYSSAMSREMERAGFAFDERGHDAWMARKQGRVDALTAHLGSLAPELTPACLNSGPQLDRFFRARLASYPAAAQRMALRAWPKTKTAQHLSTAREMLMEVLTAKRLQAEEARLVEALLVRAEEDRGLDTFGASRRHVREGRLHGQLHPAGAITGRYTSTAPNLQNIPTDKEFRSFFVAPEGRLLADCDYGQLELRTFAARSNDSKMIATFEAGHDYHDFVAKKVGCDRRKAKAINFGIIYGKGLWSLARDMGVSVEEAGKYLQGWNAEAPVGAAWREERPALYRSEGGVRTARRWIDYLHDAKSDETANTRPMNYPIQGAAADVMHAAMMLLFERYRDWPGNVVPVLTVHDEILLECDQDVARVVGELLATTMVEAYSAVLPNGPTKHLAVAGIGQNWAAAKLDGEAREKASRAG